MKVCRFFSVHFGVIGFLSEFSSNLFLIYQKISKTPWREPTSLLFCIIRQKCDYFLISKLVTYFVLWYICLNFYGLKKYFFLNVFEIFIIGGVIHVYLIFQTPPPSKMKRTRRLTASMCDDQSTDLIQLKGHENAKKSEAHLKVLEYIGKRYEIRMTDGRYIRGTMIATDKDANMVFNKVKIWWKFGPKAHSFKYFSLKLCAAGKTTFRLFLLLA